MDYIGSKEKLNDWIFSIITQDINTNNLVFMDACAGSGAISKYAATLGFSKIISNDILELSRHIIRGSISFPATQQEEADKLIIKMNALQGRMGFFYKNYSEDAGRLYFSNENAKKIDACRTFIDNHVDNTKTYLKSYLLLCLLEAMSAVSNTAGVQAAFLKKLKERAQKSLFIKSQPSLHKTGLVKTYNSDILKLLTNQAFRDGYQENILYIDPPYNERQYGPNYHLYETLVKYDNPEIYGKTGLRKWQDESRSDFCSKKTCFDFTKQIIDNTTANTIYISYNSDGLMSLQEFKEMLNEYNVRIYSKSYRRFKSDSSDTKVYNETELKEYLIEIKK